MVSRLSTIAFGLAVGAGLLPAAVTVTLSSSVPSPQPVGTAITFTATASDSNPGTLDYRYYVTRAGNSQVVQDFDTANTLTWVAATREGNFDITVVARNQSTQQTASRTASFVITSRIPQGSSTPVITPTSNPLVFLYSAPPCATGSSMRVNFWSADSFQNTNARPCLGNVSMNFYLAGMTASTEFSTRWELITTGGSTFGPLAMLTTGSIDTWVVPSPTVIRPPSANTNLEQRVVLLDALSSPPNYYFPIATDLAARVIWGYPALGNEAQDGTYFIRPLKGGTMLLVANDPTHDPNVHQFIREIDLAGNTVRQTNVSRISEQLIALGREPIQSVHHDAIRLSNGHTVVVASQERIFPAGTQGSTEPVDILGDAVIDLDENLQVAWSWSGYDHLDIERAAILGETCTDSAPGCPPVTLAPVGNDWMHTNSVHYVPADGSLIISMRHQDWLIKINYGNGSGAGDVIWRLGKDGDFVYQSTDPWPWFSHQHDAEYEGSSNKLMTVFDNGNTRIAENPGQFSRGQALFINENAMAVALVLNASLGVNAVAVSSAQLLTNGNYFFEAGLVPGPVLTGRAIEVLPNGTLDHTILTQTATYRAYRMRSLYSMN